MYHIDPNLNIPIYQQLVDAIRNDIRKGTLPDGARLPTVQSLSDALGLARGTVKRAYDQLAQLGLVELIQGRGTFVSYRSMNTNSRKEQAMTAIDGMLDQLEEMGLSMSEISIFLNLKLRERAEALSCVKVAVVECNPENLSQLFMQLRKLEQVDLYSYLLSSIQAYPYQLDEDLDLIVTTAKHAAYLETIFPERKKIARIALRLSPRSVSGIVKLQAGEVLGILCCSQRFGDLLQETCAIFTDQVTICPPEVLNEKTDIDEFLRGKTAILIPDELEKQASTEVLQKLQRFSRKGKLLRCAYEMDEGSFLYVQEKIDRLREKKSI